MRLINDTSMLLIWLLHFKKEEDKGQKPPNNNGMAVLDSMHVLNNCVSDGIRFTLRLHAGYSNELPSSSYFLLT